MKPSRKVASVALALTAAVSGAAIATPAASAAPAGNIVTLGDSYTANPDQRLNAVRNLNTPAVRNYPKTSGCLQAPNNWPAKLGAKTGAPISDWSCTAQTSHSMLGRIDSAIARGDIHRGTRAVVMAIGMNDYGPFGMSQGFQPFNAQKMRADYVRNIMIAANKVRSHAPNAKIVLSGMLAVSNPVAPHMWCSVNVVPNAPGGFPFPTLHRVEVDNENNQRAGAAAVGGTFVPMRQASGAHNTCAPDRERFVAGVIDTTTPNYNMSFHPSDKGSEFMASRIAGVV